MFSGFTTRYAGIGGGKNAEQQITDNLIFQEQQQPFTTANSPSSTSNKQRQVTILPDCDSSLIEDDSDEYELNITTSPDTTSSNDAMDFACINLTDDEEVDIWLDASTNSMNVYNTTKRGFRDKPRFLFSSKSRVSADGNGQTPKNSSADILTILLSGNLRNDIEEATSGPATGTRRSIESDASQNNNSSTSTLLPGTESMVKTIDAANVASTEAATAKLKGSLQMAFKKHCEAAKFFHQAALVLANEHKNAPMKSSLLLLSQTQAKSAIALKQVLKFQPKTISDTDNTNPSITKSLHVSDANHSRIAVPTSLTQQNVVTQKDRLRATLRGALDIHHQPEEDMSESIFLGKVVSERMTPIAVIAKQGSTSTSNGSTRLVLDDHANKNPVDDILELERELRDMDMAMEMGHSIASLGNVAARNHALMKNSISDATGSFYVVPGTNSYMSSSVMWGTAKNITTTAQQAPGQQHPRPIPNHNSAKFLSNSSSTGQNPRARANRLHNINSRHQSVGQHPSQSQQLIVPPPQSVLNKPHLQLQSEIIPIGGLESSWWGIPSTVSASQVLSSSAMAMAMGGDPSYGGGDGVGFGSSGNNAKQLIRLMDSLKTLGDENAALLREVAEAETARLEAKTAKEQMRRFKEEYKRRFDSLKEALEKFRKENPAFGKNPGAHDGTLNPLTNITSINTFSPNSISDQLHNQELLVLKLTAELRKEKEENRKKDLQLKKYEAFYKEVKTRSALKAQQRQQSLFETTVNTTTRPPGVRKVLPGSPRAVGKTTIS